MIKVLVWIEAQWHPGWLIGHHGAMVLVQFPNAGQGWFFHYEVKEA